MRAAALLSTFARVSSSPSRPDPPRRLLLIQKGALGDVTLTTALLDDLHRAFPDARLDFGVGSAAAPLLEAHPLIGERVIIDAAPAWRMARTIHLRGYDWIVDVQSSPRTAIITRLSGAAVRIGWRQRVWHRAYTHAIPRVLQQEYVIRARRRLLEAAGVPVGESGPHLELRSEERAAGAQALASAGGTTGWPRIGMLLSTTELAKNWPVRHFAALAALLARDGFTPILFDAPGDEARIAAVRAAAPEAIVAPRLRLRAFLGALAACDVLVSADTGPAHMADALGVRRVTIFGATSPVGWVPPRPTVVALCSANPPLIDRQARARAAGAREEYCADVMPDHVLGAVRELLKR